MGSRAPGVTRRTRGYDAGMDQNNFDDVPTAFELAGRVTAQHGMIRSGFHAAKEGPDDERQAATRRLLQLLAMHEAAEQLTVHPALAHAGGGPVGVGDDRASEEQQAVQLIERLQLLDYGSYEYNMQFALLEEAVSYHATAEENSELPLFEDLDATERVTIGRAFAAVERAVDNGSPVAYDSFSTMVQDARSWLTH